MKSRDSERVRIKFEAIKRESRSECRKAKASYINNKLSNSDENGNKLFWKYFKSKRKDNITCAFLKDESGVW